MRSEFGFTLAKALKFKSDLKKFTGDILTYVTRFPRWRPNLAQVKRSKKRRREEDSAARPLLHRSVRTVLQRSRFEIAFIHGLADVICCRSLLKSWVQLIQCLGLTYVAAVLTAVHISGHE